MDLETAVKNWVTVDNKVRVLNQHIRNVREERNTSEKNLMKCIESNELQNSTINISDGRLKYKISKYNPPLTLKNVRNCLEKHLDDREKIDDILNALKHDKPTIHKPSINRIYNTT